MSGAQPWGKEHAREALRRSMEIAAERFGDGLATNLHLGVTDWIDTEDRFRTALRMGAIDPARVDREVRRVRGLAEGRLVRETGYGVRLGRSTLRMEDAEHARKYIESMGNDGETRAIVRVTRIRKATR